MLRSSVDHYPSEDEKLRASKLSRRRGGNCPNSLEVLQQLVEISQSNLSLGLISVLPKRQSHSTAFIRDSLGSSVDCDNCIYREDASEPASCYVIQNQQTGSRTIVNYNGLSEMTFEEFATCVKQIELENCWFHFEVCSSWRACELVLTIQRLVGKSPRHYPEMHTISSQNGALHTYQRRARKTRSLWA